MRSYTIFVGKTTDVSITVNYVSIVLLIIIRPYRHVVSRKLIGSVKTKSNVNISLQYFEQIYVFGENDN